MEERGTAPQRIFLILFLIFENLIRFARIKWLIY